MNESQKKQAEKILETLSKQSFADFYQNGMFDAFITGYFPVVEYSRADVLKEIVKLFKLEG